MLGRKTKNSELNTAKTERISNRLDRKLIAESRQSIRRKWHTLSRNQKRVFITLWVLVMLVIGVLAFMALTNQPDSDQNNGYVTSEGVAIRKMGDADLKNEVDKIMFQKKYDSARELIRFQDSAETEEYQYLTVSTYVNQGKPDQALEVLHGIEQKFGEDWNLARYIADQYRVLKDNDKAIEYYKKALNLLKQTEDAPLKEEEIKLLESAVKSLGGGL